MVNQYTKYKDIIHICYSCDGTKTSVNKYGRPNWVINEDCNAKLIGFLCHPCYSKYIQYPRVRPQRLEKYHRLYRYGSKKQLLGNKRQLTGQCSKCPNNTRDGSCKTTHMHHWVYIILFPWYGREELCASCHAKETWKDWQCMQLKIRKMH